MKLLPIQDKRYRIGLLCFILGVLVLIMPSSGSREDAESTNIYEGAQLEVKIVADKSHVQRDDPAEGAQRINYTVSVRNTAPLVRIPTDVMLVYDKSGSGEILMADAKQAGRDFINNLDFSKDRAGVVTYNDIAYTVQPLTDSKTSIAEAIDLIRTSGWTNIGDAIKFAREELVSTQSMQSTNSVILIFTDGRPNKPESLEYAKAYAIDEADKAKLAGIRIITVAYGSYADQELMEEIASPYDGNYYFAPSGADMINIYHAVSKSLQGASPDTEVTLDLSPIEGISTLGRVLSGGRYSEGRLRWRLGTLQSGETAIVGFSLDVNNDACDFDKLELMASVTNSIKDACDSSSVITTIHVPSLHIVQSDGESGSLPGDYLSYRAVIENTGSGNAYGVIIRDTFPKGYVEVDVDSLVSGGRVIEENIVWDNNGEGFNFNGVFSPIETVGANRSKVFSFDCRIKDDLSYKLHQLWNTVSVLTAGGYHTESKNEIQVAYAPDLSIDKVAKPSVVTYQGGEVTYVLTIENKGVVDAVDVMVIDNYDETYMSVEIEEGVVEGGEIKWSVGDLKVGESKTLIYKAYVYDQDMQLDDFYVSNSTIVSSSASDVNDSDNTAFCDLRITSSPVLTIAMESDKTIYDTSEKVEYSINIMNIGGIDAYDVNLKSIIPNEFSYVAGSAWINGHTYKDPEGVYELLWELGDITQKEVLDLKFKVEVEEISSLSSRNYNSMSTLSWKDATGGFFDEETSDCAVSITEPILVPDISDLGSSADQYSDGIFRLFRIPLIKSRDFLVFLKVFFGFTLIIPLPLLFISERNFVKRSKLRGRIVQKGAKKKRSRKKDRKKIHKKKQIVNSK